MPMDSEYSSPVSNIGQYRVDITILEIVKKMKIDVEVISKVIIKPSTPTTDNHRRYQLSLIDTLAPATDISSIYFYSFHDKLLCSNNNDKLFNELKLSLAEVLTHYYPLAGSINYKENYVDCNDQGVVLSEARINVELSEIIQDPQSHTEFNKLLPDRHDHHLEKTFCLAIQVNVFKCGNVAIGIVMSHSIADGSSFFTFIKNWASIARGRAHDDHRYNNLSLEFVGASLFPTLKDGVGNSSAFPTCEDVVTKRFVFSSSVIAALREKFKYASLDDAKKEIYPTRVEAVSAFIWSRFATSTEINIGPEMPWLLLHLVNLRKRMDPPLPDDCFGNFIDVATTILTGEESCHRLVSKFKDSIGKMNQYHVKQLQNGNLDFVDVFKNFGPDVSFLITSFCRYPLYDADFGYGRPSWVGFGSFPFKNAVSLVDSKRGDGIEAWISLKKEDMFKFETDKELLAYVSTTSCA